MPPASAPTPRRPRAVSKFPFPAVLMGGILAILLFPLPARAGAWDWMVRDFEVVMKTHGQITFAPYVHGESPQADFFPGYRSDFYTFVDFFSWKGFISNWLIANTTLIERPDSTIFRLDRIRYTLTPGYRYEFDEWLISGLLLHECIHTVSRDEEEGSVWWNSFQIGLGSKGAYQMHLVEKYKNRRLDLRHRVDAQINFGAFLYGRESVWLAQNHDYRYEQFGLLRYHVGRWGNWGLFVDIPQHFWVAATKRFEAKVSPTVNLFLLGKYNIASLFYTWHAHDSSTHDNEEGLGLFGFKIVF